MVPQSGFQDFEYIVFFEWGRGKVGRGKVGEGKSGEEEKWEGEKRGGGGKGKGVMPSYAVC